MARIDPDTGATVWEAKISAVERLSAAGTAIATMSYDPGAVSVLTSVHFLDPDTDKTQGTTKLTFGAAPISWRGDGQLT